VFGVGGRLTPMVRLLLMANVAVYVVQLFAPPWLDYTLGLVPVRVARGALWQLVTYMFLHGGLWHLLFNMLILWVFGGEVETRVGSRHFARLYLASGLGGGLLAMAIGQGVNVPVVGASGALFGVLLAFAVFFPNRPVTLLLFFVLPVTMPAWALVVVFGGISLLTVMQYGGSQLGHLAHLGGILAGWLYLRWPGLLKAAGIQAGRRGVERRLRAFDVADRERRALQEEVDGLLDKISRKGMMGLTGSERRRLYEASERLKRL
jgi:membrane associated rhomboid family serine protease